MLTHLHKYYYVHDFVLFLLYISFPIIFKISKRVNSRINIPGTQINAAYDQYADSRSIDR